VGFHKFPKNRQKIAGVVVFNSEGKVLILDRGDKWDLPKGHVEPEETFLEGALRECFEETGLHHQENLDIHPYHYISIPSKKWLRFYLGFSDAEIELSDEHEAYHWVSVSEAVRLFGPDNHFSHLIQMFAIPAAEYL
jgi:8-oxo-dGTP pyrophosphatase MutT (NUDIX family)